MIPWVLVMLVVIFGAIYTDYAQRLDRRLIRDELIVESIKMRLVCDSRGLVIGATQSAAAWLGYGMDELIGLNVAAIIPVECIDKHSKAFAAHMDGKPGAAIGEYHSFSKHASVVTKSKRVKPCSLCISTFTAEIDGRVMRFASAVLIPDLPAESP